MLPGYDADPLDALTEAQHRQFAALEGVSVRLAPPGKAGDAEGTTGAWLDRFDARYVMIRPDFHVALTADTAGTLQTRFARVMRSLHQVEALALAAE